MTMAVFFRFWQLTSTPPGYHYDEAFEGLEAWHLLQDPNYRPLFFTGNFGVEPLFIYLTAVAFKLFGAEPVVQRGVAALIGALTAPAVWLLAHELRRWQPRLPRSLPLWSAAVQAGLFWAISASRIGYEPGLVPLLLCPLLWALLRALRRGQTVAWLLAGALTGLGFYTYPAGRLYPVVTAAVLLIAWLWPRLFPRAAAPDPLAAAPRRGRHFLLLTLTALLVLAPLAWQWVSNPALLLLRSRQIAVVAEGAGSASPLQTIVQHTLATAGMFSLAGDVDPRNNLPGRPVFDWFLAPFFYLGLALALWRWRQLSAAWLLAVLLIMLAPTILSEYAPHFRRALGALPIVALLTGLGLGAAADWGAARWAASARKPPWQSAWWPRLLVGACLVASIGLTARDYFGRWANSPDLFFAFDQGLWQLAQTVTTLPADSQVYLTPRPATHTTLAFAWRNGHAPATFDGRHIVVIPPDSQRPRFYAVIETEDFRSRLLLPELFPNLATAAVINDRSGQRYATLYQAPPGTAPLIRPQTPADAVWNQQARLLGFNLNPTYRPGDIIYLRLFWQALAPIPDDWTFFVHLLDAGGQNRLGADAAPGAGSYPTTRWQPGEWIIDEIQLKIPDTLAAGDYQPEIGFYLATGARIPVRQDDRLLLARLRIEAAP